MPLCHLILIDPDADADADDADDADDDDDFVDYSCQPDFLRAINQSAFYRWRVKASHSYAGPA